MLDQDDQNDQNEREQFPGNRIPGSRIDPVGPNILALYPLPTSPGLANKFLHNPVRSTDENSFDVKVDHQFSDADTAWARYSWAKSDLIEGVQIREVRNTMRKLGETKTILLSTHILQEVEALASRVILINEGRVVYDGTVQDLDPRREGLDKAFHKLTGAAA